MISFSAHRGNYRAFADVARLGSEMGVGRVWCDRVIPCGSGAGLAEQTLTPAETRELFEIMRAARTESERGGGRTDIAMHRALQFLVGGGEPYRCSAGASLVTILPNGDLLPCRRLPIKVGNVLRTPLRQLYDESEILQSLRDRRRLPSECAACVYRHACGGGLRCLAYATAGELFTIDPGCWRPGR
jgi:radical SAM protein with 4Fe4S-binding SPASM domain